MARILITDGMDKEAVMNLKNMGHETVEQFFVPEELGAQLNEFDVLIVRSATKVKANVIDAALKTARLKLIVRAGVGMDNIDVAYAEKNGIRVCNTPEASSASVAELALGHMFTLARHLHESNITMKRGEWNKNKYEGIELAGKTLGLIGFGRIAKEVAKRACALGMRVLYTNRSGKKDGHDLCKHVGLDRLLKESDFISVHIPYDSDSGALIGCKEFEMMKEGAYLINCSRGGVVDEDALLFALDSNRIAGAALDVFAEEPTKNEKLYRHSKVSLTPHIGASTAEAQSRVGKEIISIVRRLLN